MFDASAHALGTGAPMSVSKYPGSQPEQYSSGYRQFKPVPGRGYVYGPSGNWGNKHYYKYTPIKQHDGASGVLSQIEQPNAYKYKVANLGRLGSVDPQLPRGGSIMRIVGTGGGDGDEGDMRAFDSSYDWSNSGGGNQKGPMDLRPQTDVGRGDLPLGTNGASFPSTGTQTDIQLIGARPAAAAVGTQTDGGEGNDAGMQTDGGGGNDVGVQTVMSGDDIAEYLTMIDEIGAQALDLQREVRDLRAEIRAGKRAATTSSASTQTIDFDAFKAKVDELTAEFRAAYEEYTQLRATIPTSSRGLTGDAKKEWQKAMLKMRRYDNQVFGKLKKELIELHEEAGYTSREAAAAVNEFVQQLEGEFASRVPAERRDGGTPDDDGEPSVPPAMRREPRNLDEAERMADWVGNNVIDVLSYFMTPQQARIVAQKVWETVLSLFRRSATATIAILVERVMNLLANRPQNQAQAQEIAQRIIDYLTRLGGQ